MPLPRIIFAGTPEFAVPALAALLEHGWPVVGVYTQPDRPAGRGRKLRPSPVKCSAQQAGIPVYQPASFRDEAVCRELHGLRADLMIVAAYGLLLPKVVLASPRLGCVNIHASLLPRWRGAAPIQRAIAAGDMHTGISIMAMEAGLDTGPVFLTRAIDIAPRETGGSLHDRLSILGAEALLAALPGIADGSLVPSPQDNARATYAPKLGKAEARIDWTASAAAIDRQIRAFDPWPVAETSLAGQGLRIWAAEPVPADAGSEAGSAQTPGHVIAVGRAGIDVVTGDGVLRITRLQPPGKRPMPASDFVNARDLGGAVLG